MIRTMIHDFRYWLDGLRQARRHRQRFSDDFRWKVAAPSPEPRLDAGAGQVGKHLYLFGGYLNADQVIESVDLWDLKRGIWRARHPLPVGMSHSHMAVASDGQRFLYQVAGQLGPQCRPATAAGFVLDTQSMGWQSLPDLPAARYAPTMQLWRGRLHLVGGSQPDRVTPAYDHWSLGVSNGVAAEKNWRVEPSIPRGGPHRASAIVNNRLYVLGGQEGDFAPTEGEPEFTCRADTWERVHGETYSLGLHDDHWKSEAPLPIPCSHTEFSVVVRDQSIILFGGSLSKHPETFEIELTDAVQEFNPVTERWSILGHLPYRVKTAVVGDFAGRLFLTSGQRDQSYTNPYAGAIESRSWSCHRWPIHLACLHDSNSASMSNSE